MINLNLEKNTEEYQKNTPCPHIIIDDSLPLDLATEVKNEILSLDDSMFDRYDNPFEQKYTLRDKSKLPKQCKELYQYLTSTEFVKELSQLIGHELINDPDKIYWGIHLFKDGDKLDMHVDAGIDPINNLKKQVTIGLYLSHNWKPEYGGDLELWDGDNAGDENPKLIKLVKKAEPEFNRMIIFTCNDYSWHGSPHPVKCNSDAIRIFLTLSYLSKNHSDKNKKDKAYFVPLPNEEWSAEKIRLRDLRANSKSCDEVYRTN